MQLAAPQSQHIKGGNHSHSRGTIGNDLTGFLTVTAPYGGWATGGVFSADQKWSSISPGYDDRVGRKAIFSGSSGFTSSVLEWPALYSQPCHLCSLDHSRGTIGNDLTGTIQGGDNNAAFASGVFSYMEKTGSGIQGNSYRLDKVRFSGSSGTYNLLYLKAQTH